MNFIDKLKTLRPAYQKFKIHLTIPKQATTLSEIDCLKNKYEFLPKLYEDFLLNFDGFRVGWCTFIGSDAWEIAQRSEIVPLWEELINAKYIPMAVNAQGDLFTINSAGQ